MRFRLPNNMNVDEIRVSASPEPMVGSPDGGATPGVSSPAVTEGPIHRQGLRMSRSRWQAYRPSWAWIRLRRFR